MKLRDAAIRRTITLAVVVIVVGGALTFAPIGVFSQDNGNTVSTPTPGPDGDIDCSEFDTRKQVGAVFDPANDEYGLDSDEDGIACEDIGDNPTPEGSSASTTDLGGVPAGEDSPNTATATATPTTTQTPTQTTSATETATTQETTTEETTETTASASVGGSGSTPPATEVDSCTQIDQPGRYELTTDIENATTDQCIQIRARDVVLDGNGHTIDGVDDFPTSGVVVFGFAGATNVTVTNLTVTDWGDGITYEASTGTVRDSVLDSNSAGLAFTFGASGIVVADTTLADNDQAIYLQSSSANVFTNDTASGNGVAYFSDSDPQEGPSVNNTVENLHLDSATVSFESKDVVVRSVESPPADPDGRTNIGQYVNASANSPDSFLDVRVSYEESDLGDLDESTLSLWRYDHEWSEVSESTVDTDANVVSANVTDVGNGTVFAPLGETKTTETNETAYYQVDFVTGEPIENLRGPDGTYTPDRLVRFAHGDTDNGVTRVSDGEFVTDQSVAARLDTEDISVEDATATVTFTVSEGEPVTLTLASYEKVGPGWSPETEAKQTFIDADTRTFESGTHTLTVGLPTADSTEEGSGGAGGEETNGATDEGTLTAAEILARAEDSYAGVEDVTANYNATYTDTYSNGSYSDTVRARFTFKAPSQERYEFTAPPSLVGSVYADNGTVGQFYNETNGTLEIYPNYASNVTNGIDNESYLGSYLALFNQSAVTYEGIETVAGGEAYVLSVDFEYDFGGFGTESATVYLDTESYLPLGSDYRSTYGNASNGTEEVLTETTRYTDLRVNTGVSDDEFTIDPPAGTQIIDYSDDDYFEDSYRTFDSVEKAQGSVEYTIPAPTDLPEGYALENVTVDTYYNASTMQNESFVDLYYSNDSATIDVFMYRLAEDGVFYGFGTKTPVNGQAGYFDSFDGDGYLNFACGRLDYSIYGPLSRSELVTVAESVQCETDTPAAGSSTGDSA